MSQNLQPSTEAPSAGAVLAQARQQLGLSVIEVARHLKLSPAQVEALEAGAYDRLPGRVFVRGFLRNYAKLVGVDPQPLLQRIESEMPEPRKVEEPPHAPEEVMPTGERSRWPVYAGIAGVIIAALAAYEFGFNSPPAVEPDAEMSGAPAGATSSATPQGGAVDAPQAATPSAGTSDTGTPAAPTASPETSSGAPAAAAPGAPAAAPGSGAVPSAAGTAPADPTGAAAARSDSADTAASGSRALHFRFEQESWVEVRDHNDKVIFTKLNRAGSEERVTGVPPLKIVVGNARGVRLTYDARPVDLTPHTGVSVARLTLQ